MNFNSNFQLLIYQIENGHTRLERQLEKETVWLSQILMAELFQKDFRAISEHVKNIYEEKELSPDSAIRDFRIVQKEGSGGVANTNGQGFRNNQS